MKMKATGRAVNGWTLERMAREAAEVAPEKRSVGPMNRPDVLHPPRVRTDRPFVAAFAMVGKA